MKILNTSLNRSYLGMSKSFSGTLYVNLENAYTIYYELNGDFYDNGTTTVTGGGEIGTSKIATFNFSVSYQGNHYAYCYHTDRISLY